MHVYPSYRPAGQHEINQLVRDHPFAVLVSAMPGQAPVATHVPMLLPEGHDADASLVGATLRGHLGRANPHWQQLTEPGTRVLLVFSTSHAYVSPSTYDPGPTAPTLDYAAVHLTGTIEVRHGEADVLDVVEDTVAAFEARRPQPWDPTESRALFARIAPGVVTFRVTVEHQESMFKLSQDKTPAVRERIREDLLDGPRRHPDVADLLGRQEERTR